MKTQPLTLIALIFMATSAFAQENPPIVDAQVTVGVNAVSNGDNTLVSETTQLNSALFIPQLEKQKLLPFKVELWVGANPNPVQIRNLEASLAESILNYGLSLSYLNVQHQENGINEDQFQTTSLTPVLVNYSHEILPEGKMVVQGYLGAGVQWTDKDLIQDVPYANKEHLRDDKAGFYLPMGATIYGENDIVNWRIEADYALANGETDVLKQASPKVKIHNIHQLQMQSFHAGAQVELKLENLIKARIAKGVNLFARVDYNNTQVTDNLNVTKYTKMGSYYKNEVTSSSSNQVGGFSNISGQAGVKITIGGGKKKTPRPTF